MYIFRVRTLEEMLHGPVFCLFLFYSFEKNSVIITGNDKIYYECVGETYS